MKAGLVLLFPGRAPGWGGCSSRRQQRQRGFNGESMIVSGFFFLRGPRQEFSLLFP